VRGSVFWIMLGAHRRALGARRRGRRTAYLAWSAVAAITAALAIAAVAALCLVFVEAGWWWAVPPTAWLGLAPTVGWVVAERICVPRGWVRPAHALVRHAHHAGGDPGGAALVAAARALAHQAAPRAADVAYLDATAARRGRVGDAEIAAGAALAWGRGDRAAARALFESLADLAEHHPAVREIAGEWLAADDAERGAWRRILERAGEPTTWPATPTTVLLEGVAARLLGRPGAPSPTGLWARWLEAPHRRATLPLVRRALAARPAPAPTPGRPARAAATAAAAPDAPPPASPLARAIAAHVALARGPVTADRLARAAAAWDHALDDADTRIAVLQRAASLGAPSTAGDRALRDLAAAAAADLAGAAGDAGLGLAPLAGASSPTLAEAARRARQRLLGDLELDFARLADRVDERAALPAADEWRGFLALRAAYDRAAAAGGLELRRLAFVHANTAVGRLAIWLWNQRDEYVLSHAMSAWLAAEALEVGDAHALEVHAANARLRLPARRA
jgi:hypothetical protein